MLMRRRQVITFLGRAVATWQLVASAQRSASMRRIGMSFGAPIVESYRIAASYLDRILRGAKISELPVQFPTKLELVINLKTAKAIGLTIPQKFLARADDLIE